MHAHARKSYQKTQLETSSPVQLTEALFRRALRDLDEARGHIAAGDAGKKGVALNHAHEVVSALASSLDTRRAPELCVELRRLYHFVLDRINQANARVDVKPLDEAVKILRTLAEAFTQAAAKVAA